MKITEIEKTDCIKISRNSWTVKNSNTLKTKGVIRGITLIMQLSPSKLFSLHKVLTVKPLQHQKTFHIL